MCATREVTASGCDAVVAQRIERHTPDVEVVGSSPASSTNSLFGAGLIPGLSRDFSSSGEIRFRFVTLLL